MSKPFADLLSDASIVFRRRSSPILLCMLPLFFWYDYSCRLEVWLLFEDQVWNDIEQFEQKQYLLHMRCFQWFHGFKGCRIHGMTELLGVPDHRLNVIQLLGNVSRNNHIRLFTLKRTPSGMQQTHQQEMPRQRDRSLWGNWTWIYRIQLWGNVPKASCKATKTILEVDKPQNENKI